MMTATRLLESSLDKLAAKLVELEADHSAELQPVREVLATIGARPMGTKEFTSNLKRLAQAVIDVRTKPNASSSLQSLPVPPYDLWLPFKADDITTWDAEDLDEATQILNSKVKDLNPRLRPAEVGGETDAAKRRDSVDGGECEQKDPDGSDR